MQACFILLCFLAEISKQPENQIWTVLCSSLPFLLWHVTAQFTLACTSTEMWFYTLLLGGRRCETEDLLFLWGVPEEGLLLTFSQLIVNTPPFLNAVLWSSLLPFAAVVQLQGAWDKMEYCKDATALTSLAGWGRGAVFLSRECPDGYSSSSGTWWIVSHGT